MASRARWLTPLPVAAVIAAGAALPAVHAGAAPKLTPRSAAQLLVAVAHSHVTGVSGTVKLTTNLGLPSLPSGAIAAGGDSPTSLTNLVSGTHTLRVWAAQPAKVRVAVVGQLAETELVSNGRDVWMYDSTKNTYSHGVLPAHSKDAQRAAPPPGTAALTPQQAAERALAAIDPTTAVTVAHNVKVAGQASYELRLAPRTAQSLIGSITIAIDAKTGMPLRVEINARGQKKPAVEIAYTSVHYGVPAASRFQFTPPPGAHRVPLPLGNPLGGRDAQPAPSSSAQPRVVGHGWAAVLALPDVAAPSAPLTKAATPVSGKFGSGLLLHTTLVNVLFTDDGRAFVGAVTADRLESVAASTR